MSEDHFSLTEYKTWALVTLSAGRKAIANKWVFNAKVDEN